MKKIGIDARLYSQTGVGTYIRNLLYYLTKKQTDGFIFYLYFLPEDSKKLPALPHNFIIRFSPYKWHTIQEQIGFLFTLQKDKLDLMHFTYFGFPILYKGSFIATIHDITPILYKTGKASTKSRFIYDIKSLVFKYVLQTQVRKAKMIITPSNTVKQSLIQLFGKEYENKITYIYEGINYELIKAKQNSELKNRFKDPFYIYIGNFYPHKNLERLISAFSLVKTNAKLILIGPKDYFSNIIKIFIKNLMLNDRVILYHNASSSDLVFFYKNAIALIHPSLSEGFGLPLIEASYYKCPVIVSNIPIFHELLSNNCIFFDPLNTQDIIDKIKLFLKRKSCRNYSEIRSSMSFDILTERMLSLYEEIS